MIVNIAICEFVYYSHFSQQTHKLQIATLQQTLKWVIRRSNQKKNPKSGGLLKYCWFRREKWCQIDREILKTTRVQAMRVKMHIEFLRPLPLYHTLVWDRILYVTWTSICNLLFPIAKKINFFRVMYKINIFNSHVFEHAGQNACWLKLEYMKN